MGGSQPKPKPIDPRDQIEDAILNLRMTAKSFEHSANRAEKEQKKEIERAKIALKKNNEEGARLFLQNAATKYQEASTMRKMSARMDALSAKLKTNMNNSDLGQTLQQITPMLKLQEKFTDVEAMSKNLSQFQNSMDELTIAGQIMDSSLNQDANSVTTEKGVDNMLTQLKAELNSEISENLMQDPTLLYNDPNKASQKEAIPTIKKM